ncbi:MAG: TraY domain-containing protein [Veillonellales bacterium]
MTSDSPRITVRLEGKLKKKLRRLARKNGRSLSREAEHILIKHIQNYENRFGEIKVD